MARQARGKSMDPAKVQVFHTVQRCGTQFGDNHKVKLGRKRSKTNSVKLGGMASGLWVSLET